MKTEMKISVNHPTPLMKKPQNNSTLASTLRIALTLAFVSTSAALMTGAGARLRIDAEAQFPNSIGLIYSAVTAALGFDADGDWHKTMWLSPTGKPEFKELFAELLRVDERGLPVVNADYLDLVFGGRTAFSDHFFERAGVGPRRRDEPMSQGYSNLAASAQKRVEEVLDRLVMATKSCPAGRKEVDELLAE